MTARAVFLDRDGTLCEERGFLTDEAHLRLLATAGAAVRRIQAAGLRAVVVTNQSGLARGLFDDSALARIHRRLVELLAAEGARLDAIYHCPHHPEGRVRELAVHCDCRKPEPGLLLRAGDELQLDLARSYVVGDRRSDLDAGARVGAQTVLVLTGCGREQLVAARGAGAPLAADFVARDLLDAVEWIARRERRGRAA